MHSLASIGDDNWRWSVSVLQKGNVYANVGSFVGLLSCIEQKCLKQYTWLNAFKLIIIEIQRNHVSVSSLQSSYFRDFLMKFDFKVLTITEL